jgi:hypothetical protein
MPSTTTGFSRKISSVETPVQLARTQFRANLVKTGSLIRATEGRTKFSVTGTGLTVAVLDTGLRTTHVDFTGRVVAQYNFTNDNSGNNDDASDGNGHGTNVTGIIAANKLHIGIAPGAQIIPLKVLSNDDGGSFDAINDALQWVIDNRSRYNITAVCMSLGDSDNYTDDEPFSSDEIRLKIQSLRNEKVAVVVAAGNDFYTHSSQQGMSYPAIFRETVSVGAVYDAREGSFTYSSGAATTESAPDRITPFSQRLHETINPIARTDIFAPGAPITSSGILNDRAESVQHGTSQATPVITGVILLLQEYYLKLTGLLPSVDEIETYLRDGGIVINDGDDEQDNVENTGLSFIRVDVLGALENITRRLQKAVFEEKKPLEALYANESLSRFMFSSSVAPSSTIKKTPPKQVIEMLASRPHRMHHYIWHQVRNSWHEYPAETKAEITRLGWNPPRTAFYEGNVLALDNYSGEDFLYMHRQMINQVNEMLATINDPNYPKVEPWESLPAPTSSEFPVPPAWDTGNDRFTQRLARLKSEDYFSNVMQVWEKYYLLEDNLRRLSLGQLGALLEFTIHNNMHMRWAAQPADERPDPAPTNPEAIPTEWDDLSYDYLGDTYSSHVNPIFWYLHGWVDQCIDRWQEANRLDKIEWVGTWVGKLPPVPQIRPNNFIRLMHEHEHGDDQTHNHHLHEMIEVVKLIGECGIFTEFYSDLLR